MTKGNLKNATGVDTLKFAEKADLASLKSETDKLDIDKFKIAPVDLIKPSDAVKNEVVKKATYDNLVKNVLAVQNIDTSNLVKKLTRTQKLVKLKEKLLIMIIIICILPHKNLIK